MIEFRCWYCNRRHLRPKAHVGQKFECACKYPLRVPSRSGGNARVFSLGGFLVSRFVYGLGGGLFGLAIALLIGLRMARRLTEAGHPFGLFYFLSLPALGFLVGAVFGESGINAIGQLFRSDHNNRR